MQIRIMLKSAQNNMRCGWVKRGKGVMEFAVCYDHSGFDLAWSIFLDLTAFLALMTPWAIARLIEIAREDAATGLQVA